MVRPSSYLSKLRDSQVLAKAISEALARADAKPALAIIAAALGAAPLGAMLYLGVMRPLASYPVTVGVLATIALGLMLHTIVTVIWSAQTRYPAELLGRTGQPITLLGGVSVSGIDMLIIAAAVIAMIGFPLLLRLSTVGIEMRGVAENAFLMGGRHRDGGRRRHFLFDQGPARTGYLVRRPHRLIG